MFLIKNCLFLLFLFPYHKGNDDLEEQSDLEYSDNHRFTFNDPSDDKATDFEKKILKNPEFGDTFYFMLGHPENKEANKLHLKSYYALSKRLFQSNFPVKAASVNHDLSTAQQHHEHVQQSYWTSDEWLIDYGQEELGLATEDPIDRDGHDFDFLGIIVHSWDDCMDDETLEKSTCLHVVQIRNYGHYFPHNLTKHHLEPIFNWVASDLGRNAQIPTLIIFQEFDTDQNWLAQAALKDIFSDNKKLMSQNLLAVVFSLMSKNVTLDASLCYGNDAHFISAPLLSFSQLPANSYLSVKFNPSKKGAKNFYRMDVHNETHTIVNEVNSNKNKNCLRD